MNEEGCILDDPSYTGFPQLEFPAQLAAPIQIRFEFAVGKADLTVRDTINITAVSSQAFIFVESGILLSCPIQGPPAGTAIGENRIAFEFL